MTRTETAIQQRYRDPLTKQVKVRPVMVVKRKRLKDEEPTEAEELFRR